MKTRRQEDKKTRRQEVQRADTVVTVELTDMAPTGEAIGRVDGVVLFVPFGAPGDQAEVLITERKRTFARGRLLRLLAAAPQRVTPLCPYFTVCGGCEWQHLPYAEQVRLKTEHVRSHLTRIGKLVEPTVLPCLPSPQPYGYRNHARLQCTPAGAIGYRAARSHEVVAISTCPILEPELDKAVQRLALAPPTTAPAEIQLRVAMPLPIGAYTYHFGPDAFFQANTAIAAQLVTAVLQALTLRGNEQVLELYCGGGLFTIPIADAGASVFGVEANGAALADAQVNAVHAGVHERVALLAAPVEEALTQPAVQERSWDAIVLDPPRAGVTPSALTTLLTFGAPKIVYISCDPATLARDAQLLSANGYRLCYAQPFDMFPQTHHVETVALFERLCYV
ncbi:MAG: class I SAM-dependent RNA methyltransferase [Caldilinea sp. CFX5]|nr:class I SAM-dependent RNA methyltransferase [Caldilinea sp. CFX5]